MLVRQSGQGMTEYMTCPESRVFTGSRCLRL